MPPLGIAPRLSAPQAEVLLLYYSGALWRCRASIPDLNLAKVVCYHLQHTPLGCASAGTRTRILCLEGTNTTLVLRTRRESSITGNRTPGICVTGRDVTNYTMTDRIAEPPARVELATLRLLSACSAN